MKIIKTLKWLIPIISYLLFMGLIYLTGEIQYLVLGQKIREPDQPVIIPDYFLFIIIFPLIPIGYLFIPLAQFIFQKSQKGFIILAGIIFLIVFSLLIMVEYFIYGSVPLKTLCFIFVLVSIYCVPYFLILYYTLKKEKNLHN